MYFGGRHVECLITLVFLLLIPFFVLLWIHSIVHLRQPVVKLIFLLHRPFQEKFFLNQMCPSLPLVGVDFQLYGVVRLFVLVGLAVLQVLMVLQVLVGLGVLYGLEVQGNLGVLNLLGVQDLQVDQVVLLVVLEVLLWVDLFLVGIFHCLRIHHFQDSHQVILQFSFFKEFQIFDGQVAGLYQNFLFWTLNHLHIQGNFHCFLQEFV